MEVAFITPSVSRSSGGIFEVELALAKSLQHLGCDIRVYGQNDENTSNDLSKWDPIKVETFSSIGPHAFRYSPSLKNAVVKSNCQIAHLQVIWMYTSVVANNWHKTGKPYVVTIHGMLEPWALKNAKWKKDIVKVLYENRCLKNAACIHAQTYKEYQDIRKFGLKNPVCVIPNGVDLPQDNLLSVKPVWYNQTNNKKVLLFIGRLHPKKGLDNLLKAWASVVDKKEWCLVIAGWGDSEYMDALKTATKELQIEDDVIFAGPQFEAEKQRTFMAADAFILPSFSEGLPMAVLEAWSYQLPTLITPACNLPDSFENNAAIKIEPTPDSIVQGLQNLFLMTEEQRKLQGKIGFELVKAKYTWNKIAQQMASVYRWILSGNKKPDYVYTD